MFSSTSTGAGCPQGLWSPHPEHELSDPVPACRAARPRQDGSLLHSLLLALPRAPPWPLCRVGGHRGCCPAGDGLCKVLSGVRGACSAEPRSAQGTLCVVGRRSGPLGQVLPGLPGVVIAQKVPPSCLVPAHACRHPSEGCCSLPIPRASGHAQGEEVTGSLPGPLVPRDALVHSAALALTQAGCGRERRLPSTHGAGAPLGRTPGLDLWVGRAWGWGGRGQMQGPLPLGL